MEKQNSSRFSRPACSSSWVRGKCIGRGCFGTVSTAVNKSDCRVFAVKSVDLATCLLAQAESLENEIGLLRSLTPHPYVVEFLGDDMSREGTATYRNLHLEYMPRGTVADVVADVVDEGLIRRYAWCLVSALRHLHSNGIVHCDIKGRNVLMGHDLTSVKLGDFGSAVMIKPDGCGHSTTPIVPRGSPLWMAPEVIRREYQGPESDVWSLGCTVIEMVTGKPAWEDRGVDSLSRIGFSDELPLVSTRLSELGRDFLDKCLRRDPSQRWSCDQLLHHPFLSFDHYSFSTESSPRCVLDWVNPDFEEEETSVSGTRSSSELEVSARMRMCKLAATRGAIWESDGWVDVRGFASEEEETSKEYTSTTWAGSETEGTSSVYSDLERTSEESEIENERTRWESCKCNCRDYLEWQYRNSDEVEVVERGSTNGFGGGGSSCRYGPGNVGSAVVRREMVACNLLSTLLLVENVKLYSIVLTIMIITYYNKKKFNFILSLRLYILHVIRTELSNLTCCLNLQPKFAKGTRHFGNYAFFKDQYKLQLGSGNIIILRRGCIFLPAKVF